MYNSSWPICAEMSLLAALANARSLWFCWHYIPACPASARLTPGRKKPLKALTKWKHLLCQKSIQLLTLLEMQMFSNLVWYSSHAFLVTAFLTSKFASFMNLHDPLYQYGEEFFMHITESATDMI